MENKDKDSSAATESRQGTNTPAPPRQVNISVSLDGKTLRIAGIALAVVLLAIATPIAISSINSSIEAQQEAERAAAKQSAIETRHRTLFNDTADDCLEPGDTAIIADDELSWFVDGRGNDFGSGSTNVTELVCILEALEMPAPMQEQVSNTNSLMGIQSGNWADLSAEWSYHPDNGLDINFEFTN